MAVIKGFTVGIHRSALFKIIVSQFSFFIILHPILDKVNIRWELNFSRFFFYQLYTATSSNLLLKLSMIWKMMHAFWMVVGLESFGLLVILCSKWKFAFYPDISEVVSEFNASSLSYFNLWSQQSSIRSRELVKGEQVY